MIRYILRSLVDAFLWFAWKQTNIFWVLGCCLKKTNQLFELCRRGLIDNKRFISTVTELIDRNGRDVSGSDWFACFVSLYIKKIMWSHLSKVTEKKAKCLFPFEPSVAETSGLWFVTDLDHGGALNSTEAPSALFFYLRLFSLCVPDGWSFFVSEETCCLLLWRTVKRLNFCLREDETWRFWEEVSDMNLFIKVEEGRKEDLLKYYL